PPAHPAGTSPPWGAGWSWRGPGSSWPAPRLGVQPWPSARRRARPRPAGRAHWRRGHRTAHPHRVRRSACNLPEGFLPPNHANRGPVPPAILWSRPSENLTHSTSTKRMNYLAELLAWITDTGRTGTDLARPSPFVYNEAPSQAQKEGRS